MKILDSGSGFGIVFERFGIGIEFEKFGIWDREQIISGSGSQMPTSDGHSLIISLNRSYRTSYDLYCYVWDIYYRECNENENTKILGHVVP